jgi:hypothetical protein
VNTTYTLSKARIRRELIALRAEDEGWHTLASAQSDGFVTACGGVIPPADVEATAEWSEIHDLGTRYCMECLAIAEGEWTGARFPNSLLHARRSERERRFEAWKRGTEPGYLTTTITEHFLREQERGPKA